MTLRYLTVSITAAAIVGLAMAATPTSGPTLGSAIKPQVTPLACSISAGNPHISQSIYESGGGLYVDTHGLGTCNQNANMKAQATLYYISAISPSFGVWTAANPSPLAVVVQKQRITTKQSNVACSTLLSDQYKATAVLWVNGGSPKDSPVNGPISVPCVPPKLIAIPTN